MVLNISNIIIFILLLLYIINLYKTNVKMILIMWTTVVDNAVGKVGKGGKIYIIVKPIYIIYMYTSLNDQNLKDNF